MSKLPLPHFSSALQNYKIPKKQNLQSVIVIPESSSFNKSRRGHESQSRKTGAKKVEHRKPEKFQKAKYMCEVLRRPDITYNTHRSKPKERLQVLSKEKQHSTVSIAIQVEAPDNKIDPIELSKPQSETSEPNLTSDIKSKKGRVRCPECRRRHSRKDCPVILDKRSLRVAVHSRPPVASPNSPMSTTAEPKSIRQSAAKVTSNVSFEEEMQLSEEVDEELLWYGSLDNIENSESEDVSLFISKREVEWIEKDD